MSTLFVVGTSIGNLEDISLHMFFLLIQVHSNILENVRMKLWLHFML